MAEKKFNLIVLGGGPGGYVAAIRASQLGMKTALIEREHLGGICLNWGCIPTKALLRSAEVYHAMQHASSYGLSITGEGAPGFDIKQIVARSRAVSAQLSGGVRHLLKKNKVAIFEGHGRLARPRQDGLWTLSIDQDGKAVDEISAENVILATGARARVLPGLEPDGKLVWTYKEALVPESLPKRLLVVGSGAIGIEFASFYHTFGSEVTVVEVMDRILPAEDAEISDFALKSLRKQGMTLHTGTTVAQLDRKADHVVATLDKGGLDKGGKQETLTIDRVITAIGITGNVEDIGLDHTRVKVERSHIEVDGWLQTAEPGLYAIGDLVAPPWLAHKASHEGILCVEKMAGRQGLHPLDPDKVPGCTYCRPQVASIGLTEDQAKERGHDLKIGRFPFMANGKAIALGEPEGLVKTLFDAKTGELLGAHMVGAEVTEMIQGYGIAMGLETTEAELMHTIFPHPTLSEMMHESVLDAYGRALHF